MACSEFKRLSDTIRELEITYNEAVFIQSAEFVLSDFFREDLAFVMREGVTDNSEFAICENLIYPLLKEVWKPFSQKLTLWSHQYLTYSESLSGFPEYILARRSPLGKIVFDRPYSIVVEAKQDNFDAGWGQCLAELVAAQRLNEHPNLQVFGIVSNGTIWEFGRLKMNAFTKQPFSYSIFRLDELASAIHYVFLEAEQSLEQFLAIR